ncbi:hypothetical protein LINPERHAP1_LOCUS41212 [Linum perenne]
MQGSDYDVEAVAPPFIAVNHGVYASDLQVDLEKGWPAPELKVSGRSKSSNLSIEIPIGPAPCFAESCNGKGVLHCHSLRFKINSSIFDHGRRSFCLSSYAGAAAPEQSPTKSIPTSTLFWRQCSSLPATPISSYVSVQSLRQKEQQQEQDQIVPTIVIQTNDKEQLVDACKDQLVPTIVIQTNEEKVLPEEYDDEGICRICLDTIREDGDKMKLACGCKGDLRMVHEECAVSWFSTKGNKVCEICDLEVTNLPVIVFREDSLIKTDDGDDELDSQSWPANDERSSVQEFLLLVLMSTVAYFFVLELLLVQEKTSRGLAIAAPFAFGLGILGSMLALILGVKEHVWRYAILEFALISVTIHLAYMMLNVEPVYSIMLGSVIGMVLAMSINALYRHYNSPATTHS